MIALPLAERPGRHDRYLRSPLRLATSLALLALAGCMPPQNNQQRLLESARDMNLATRFGRLDIAAERTDDESRSAFLEKRRAWGQAIRVVDIDILGVENTAPDEADVTVMVSWTRMDEGLLRATRIEQHWSNLNPRGWTLRAERRLEGDLGLLGDAPAAEANAPRRDVHFPSRTLGQAHR